MEDGQTVVVPAWHMFSLQITPIMISVPTSVQPSTPTPVIREESEVEWGEVKCGIGRGGGRIFMEKVYRSSKWWEVKDWGESVSELMIVKKNNYKKLHTVLSCLGVFNFCACCKILICLVCIVASFKLSCVYCYHLMCICCTMCVSLFSL